MLETTTAALLEIEGLRVAYDDGERSIVACEDISLRIHSREVVGLAGESGCGKSTVANAILRLIRPPGRITGGTIRFAGRNILELDTRELRRFRWAEVAMVFQSAMNSLNPVMTVRAQIEDVFRAHAVGAKLKQGDPVIALLEQVGLSASNANAFPHELSGGMRQRVVIAMALALKPRLLILDEPTTALDVVIQKEIMTQIATLRDSYEFATLLISHDLSLMVESCDRIAVMYAGRLVEIAGSADLYAKPIHPYSRALMDGFPPISGPRRRLTGIPDNPPDMARPPSGCRFHPRCGRAAASCSFREPVLTQVAANRSVACPIAAPLGAIT